LRWRAGQTCSSRLRSPVGTAGSTPNTARPT